MKKRDIKYIIKKVIIGVLIVLLVGSINKCNVKADVINNLDAVINNIELNSSYSGTGSDLYRLSLNPSSSSITNRTIYSETITVGNHSPIELISTSGMANSFYDSYYIRFKYVDRTTNSILYTIFVFYRPDYLPEYVLDRVDMHIEQDANSLFYNSFTYYSHPKSGTVDDIVDTEQWYFYSYSYSTYLDSTSSFIGILNDLTYDTLDTYVISEYNNNLLNFYLPINQNNSYSDFYREEPVFKEDFFTTFSIDSTNLFTFLVNGEDITHRNDLEFWWEEGSDTNSEGIANGIIHSLDNNTLGQYLDFITIPFNFLRSFTSATCSPIEIPIPFVGGTITLPCISSLLNQYVSQLYNIIVIVVNGFIVYRITMRNIDTCTDVVKADDDKIEVIDL